VKSEFAGSAERKKHLIPRALSVLNAETSGKRLFTSRAKKKKKEATKLQRPLHSKLTGREISHLKNQSSRAKYETGVRHVHLVVYWCTKR